MDTDAALGKRALQRLSTVAPHWPTAGRCGCVVTTTTITVDTRRLSATRVNVMADDAFIFLTSVHRIAVRTTVVSKLSRFVRAPSLCPLPCPACLSPWHQCLSLGVSRLRACDAAPAPLDVAMSANVHEHHTHTFEPHHEFTTLILMTCSAHRIASAANSSVRVIRQHIAARGPRRQRARRVCHCLIVNTFALACTLPSMGIHSQNSSLFAQLQ